MNGTGKNTLKLTSGTVLKLPGLAGAYRLTSGSVNLFMVRLENGEPASFFFLGSPVFFCPTEAVTASGGGNWILVVVAAGEAEAVAMAERAGAWTELLADFASKQAKMEITGTSPLAILSTLLAVILRKQEYREQLAGENRVLAESDLQEKLAALGALAGLQIEKEPVQAETGEPLRRALREIARIYRLPAASGEALTILDNTDRKLPVRLRDFCAAAGWRLRKVELEADFYRRTSLPVLGFRKNSGEPAVLYPNANGSRIYDPVSGRKTPLDKTEAATLECSAYCFYELFPEKRLTKKVLLRFVFANARGVLVMAGVIGLFSALLGLIVPVATEYVTGKIIPTANYSELYQLAALLAVLTLCGVGFQLIPSLVMLVFSARQFERFQAAVYDHILRIPVKAFKVCDAGDMTQRVLGATQIQQTVFTIFSGQFLGSVFSLFSLIMMFYYAPKLAVTGMVLVIIYATGMFFLSRINLKPLAAHTAAAGRLSGLLKQFLDGMAKIRAAAAETRIISRCMDDFSVLTRQQYVISRNSAVQAVFSAFYPMFISLLFYALIGGVWRKGMTLPIFLAFMAAFQNFQSGVTGFAGGLWRLLAIRPDVERILPLLQMETEDAGGKHAPGTLNGNIEVSHLSFRYAPDMPPVLQDVSLHANPGELVAVAGPSGAGKSTLVRLLLGFEKPETGGVYYSGQDLENLDVRAVRRQLGVILQNSMVISGSILENINIGTECTLDDAWEALRLAAMDKVVEDMPMGIHTLITPNTISGGQQQRILIARALVGKPVAVILDESTSSLDNIAQETVRTNLDRLHMTRIVIAHRLSTIANADRIYVLDKGKVVQSGTYKELTAAEGLFKRLVERQLTEERN